MLCMSICGAVKTIHFGVQLAIAGVKSSIGRTLLAGNPAVNGGAIGNVAVGPAPASADQGRLRGRQGFAILQHGGTARIREDNSAQAPKGTSKVSCSFSPTRAQRLLIIPWGIGGRLRRAPAGCWAWAPGGSGGNRRLPAGGGCLPHIHRATGPRSRKHSG